ncbi:MULTISPECIES: hypothetical protein [unclassified Bradyrhizobium]|uniref:hypothetical protein n=1 Tax=unclassified Bradyrhizobium TaxID=2631580 RepID=UPI00247A66CF|nr:MULTISPECIES: hypothetical protein [unclassified Bradyrhizobium]WGS24122.1 hypothetical protein MTX22_32235 [Bradyrhizobium sp. ISRA463]WGS31542.1 hypothetical protein MTX19_29790 [Bradyrhizobium sp. ISRA464]
MPKTFESFLDERTALAALSGCRHLVVAPKPSDVLNETVQRRSTTSIAAITEEKPPLQPECSHQFRVARYRVEHSINRHDAGDANATAARRSSQQSKRSVFWRAQSGANLLNEQDSTSKVASPWRHQRPSRDRRLAATVTPATPIALTQLGHVAMMGQRADQAPLALSAEDVARFLEAVPILRDRIALVTAYAAGATGRRGRPPDASAIDSKRMLILMTARKGGNDRYMMLSLRLLIILRSYWYLAKPRHWLSSGCNLGDLVSVATSRRLAAKLGSMPASISG